MHASEEEMQKAIILRPEIIEPGFKILEYEKRVPPGFVDVFGADTDGNLVVIEIKKDPAGFPVVKQLLEYVKYLEAPVGKKLRAVIVAPSIAKGSQATLARSGIEFKQLTLQKAVEILHLPATDSTAPEIGGFVEKAKSIMVFALGYSMLRDFYL